MSTQLGLRENWAQFSLLVFVNALVGGMIGMERSILPSFANKSFGMDSHAVLFSFIVVFGITKAFANYYAGYFANHIGRRNLLIFGWFIAIPIPFIFMWAPTWNWIVGANVLLGINQGLAWSSTVTMKMDLVGDRDRGLAMGINEFAGYLSVGLVAFFTAWIASTYGIRPYPFYLGIVFVALGLLLSVFLVRDTRRHVSFAAVESSVPRLTSIFWDTTWYHPNLGSVTQAGLLTNLNDGMMWGLFPILLSAKGFTITEIGFIVALYPMVWGVAQLGAGKLSDLICQKDILIYGMLVQGIALLALLVGQTFWHFAVLSVLLGLGTAMVYPTFMAAVAQNTHPVDRAESLGVFRLWRDLGYSIGALMTGIFMLYFPNWVSIVAIATLTILSAGIIKIRMRC